MKKRVLMLCLGLATALLLCGCARTINELYSPPKRSEEYSCLQSAIDIAMAGLEYCAPLTGENQQAVQKADLNGDGIEEYLVFAKGNSDKPLQILIFVPKEDGSVEISEVISSNGSAFELVQYEDIDGKPGLELVVGRQVSNQLMGSVCVYSFASGRSERLMSAGYSRLLTMDLGGSEQKELLLIQRGESDQANAVAVVYRYRAKSMVRSLEVELSQPVSSIKRCTAGKLQDGTAAVFVSSATEESAIRTDILALRKDRLMRIAVQDPMEYYVPTLGNYYVFADDVDEDGITEIPSLIPMQPTSSNWVADQQYLIRWYSTDLNGKQTDKLFSFHNYADGWYLAVDQNLTRQLTVNQVGNNYAFFLWDEGYEVAMPAFTIYALYGSDRESQAGQDGRFLLRTSNDVIYAAKLESDLSDYGLNKEYLTNNFHLIHQEWKSGDT